MKRMLARLRGRRDPASGIDVVGAVAEQLSVLTSAGVSNASAWAHLAAGGGAAGYAEAAARAASEGEAVHLALLRAIPEPDGRGARDRGAEQAWSTLAAAWAVAAECGAPLAGCLRELAAAMRDEAQSRREVATALAGPRASARMVTALPIVAVVFGALLGFDTGGVLFGTPIGLVCLGIGLLLLWGGHRWNAVLARSATARDVGAALELDLLAIAMAGGVSLARARETVLAALESAGLRPRASGEVDRVADLAAAAGAPLAELLRAEAFRLRRTERAAATARAAALGVRLMLPLGACVLPAFVLLGVAPLIISVVTGTFGSTA
ncbi:type II secretion system F family protein [Agromyces soli]